MCPSLGQLLNFPDKESFHGIDKFTHITIDPGAAGGPALQAFPEFPLGMRLQSAGLW
jgi:hypothetical protein